MERLSAVCTSNIEAGLTIEKANSINASSNFSYDLNKVSSKRGFKMLFLNIVSLPKNIDEIRCSLSKGHIDLIAFNETRLDSTINDDLMHVTRYDLIRKDRSRNGGGVCIYLRNTINYKIRNDLVSSNVEAICIEIIKPQSKPFLVATIYRPPSAPSEFLNEFEK